MLVFYTDFLENYKISDFLIYKKTDSKIDNRRNIIKSNNIGEFYVCCNSRNSIEKRIRVGI